MEIFIKAAFQKANSMDSDNITGQMVVFTRATFKTDFVMEMVYGRNLQEVVISMRESIAMIKNKVMVFLLGIMAIFIRDIIWMM